MHLLADGSLEFPHRSSSQSTSSSGSGSSGTSSGPLALRRHSILQIQHPPRFLSPEYHASSPSSSLSSLQARVLCSSTTTKPSEALPEQPGRRRQQGPCKLQTEKTACKMVNLLDLPLDVLGIVLKDNIRAKSDLRTLCLACSSLRTLSIPNLYDSVEVRVKDGVLWPSVFKCMLDPKNDGPRFIKHLRVGGSLEVNEAAEMADSPMRMDLVNVLVMLLLKRITKDQLLTFEWLLPVTISTEIIQELQTQQCNLRKIKWKYEHKLGCILLGAQPMRLANLASLSTHNVTTVDQMDYVQRWISNCNSLKKLEISTSWKILKEGIDKVWNSQVYETPVKCFFGSMIDKANTKKKTQEGRLLMAKKTFFLADEMDEDDEDMYHPVDFRLQLKSLKLSGFPILSSASLLNKAINLSVLSSLTLRNCTQTDKLLDYWRLVEDTPRLQQLHLLMEANDPNPESVAQTIACVNKFIGCFSGLKELVLMSRIHTRTPMDEIGRHSRTLERLVMDLRGRSKGRLLMKYDRLLDIYKNYPRLRELGVSASFNDSMLNLLGLLCKNLVTLQIRNTRRGDCAKSRFEDVTAIAKSCVATPGGRLKIISMATDNTPPQQLLGIPNDIPREDDRNWNPVEVFYVQKAVNILGKSVPILTKIGVKKARELVKGRVGVLGIEWESSSRW